MPKIEASNVLVTYKLVDKALVVTDIRPVRGSLNRANFRAAMLAVTSAGDAEKASVQLVAGPFSDCSQAAVVSLLRSIGFESTGKFEQGRPHMLHKPNTPRSTARQRVDEFKAKQNPAKEARTIALLRAMPRPEIREPEEDAPPRTGQAATSGNEIYNEDFREEFENYQGTIIAPKSLIPVSIYSDGRAGVGTSPDMTRRYASTSLDGHEEWQDYQRTHMSPGISRRDDKGKGLGTAMYMGMVLVCEEESPHSDGVFSPNEGGSEYAGRSYEATKAWNSMVRHGIANRHIYTINEYKSDTIKVEDLLTAGEHPLDDWTSIESVDPKYVDVSGEAETEISIDTINMRGLLESGLLLDLSEGREGNFAADFYNPPPVAVFRAIDFSATDTEDVLRFAMFCAKGDDEQYNRYVDSARANPTCGKLPNADQLTMPGLDLPDNFGIRPKGRKNPGRPVRRRNPAADAAEARQWRETYTRGEWE